jgi:hypothetical protein
VRRRKPKVFLKLKNCRKIISEKRLAEQGGQDLNPLFAELADWEAQLKPLDQRVFEKLGGPSL